MYRVLLNESLVKIQSHAFFGEETNPVKPEKPRNGHGSPAHHREEFSKVGNCCLTCLRTISLPVMHKHVVFTTTAPAPIGPYSQAVMVNGTLYVSGQVAIALAESGADIGAETRQVMLNLGEILQAAGLSYQHIVKTTIFLKDMNQFAAVNAVYGHFFTDHFPARETVEVARLPKNVNVEISCIAVAEKMV